MVWKDIFGRLERTEQIALDWTGEKLLFVFFDIALSRDARRRVNTIVLVAKYYLYDQNARFARILVRNFASQNSI